MPEEALDLYACATPSHRELVEQHFLPSIPPTLVLRELREIEQPELVDGSPSSGIFDSPGFVEATIQKIEYVAGLCAWRRSPFLFADVDLRFYGGGHAGDLLRELGDADIAFQSDGPGAHCTGFMVVRPSSTTLRLFALVLAHMRRHHVHDQTALNIEIGRSGARGVSLPTSKYWTIGHQVAPTLWFPGIPVDPPEGILMHHGNWTMRMSNKLALLSEVRKVVASRG